ncbi:MAG: SufD family Fe-S cluster assembly protein, partial [Myxococcota bacterium]
MNTLAAECDRVVSGFRGSAGAVATNGPGWLPPLRETAIDRFALLGFPSMKREDWKYTNVRPIAAALAAAADAAADATSELPGWLDAASMEHRLVFSHGRFSPELSRLGDLPGGAVVDALAEILRDDPERVRPLLEPDRADDDRCFVALNSAFQRDGAFLSLPSGAAVDQPIHLVFLSDSDASRTASHVRNLITLGPGASAVVVEHYVGSGDQPYVTNAVTTVALAANASLDHVAVKSEGDDALHVGTLRARVERDARFRSHAFSLEASLARTEISVTLAGVGAECTLNGLYLAGGRQHVDNQTTIDHAHPNGTSHELYKGVLGGRANGVFNGSVIVRPGALKSDARQSNANLLLSDRAEINTR